MRKYVAQVLTALAIAGAVGMPIFVGAEEIHKPQLVIGVTVETEGVCAQTGKPVTIKLVADEPEYPMPEGTSDRVSTLKIEKTGTFQPICYQRAGVYTYRVFQQKEKREGLIYDESVYVLRVLAAYQKDGNFGLTVTAHKQGQEEKQEKLVFYNVCDTCPAPPQTGDTCSVFLWTGLSVVSFLGCIVLRDEKRRAS